MWTEPVAVAVMVGTGLLGAGVGPNYQYSKQQSNIQSGYDIVAVHIVYIHV